MSTLLDKPLPKSGTIVWQTIVKNGKRYTLQVFVRTAELERLVSEQIDEREHDWYIESEAGPISFSVTRQS